MENDYIFPAPNRAEDKKLPIFDKIVKTALGLGILIFVAGISYLLGSKSMYQKDSTLSSYDAVKNQITSPSSTLPPQQPSPTPLQDLKLSPTPKDSYSTPSATPTLAIKTKIIPSINTLDGFRSSTGSGSSTVEIRVGRNENLVSRGFVSFDLSTLPQGVEIYEATLRLYQAQVIGNPYSSQNKLRLDHITYGDSLDASDFSSPALSSNFAVLSQDSKLGWKEAEVRDRLKEDLANARSISQFRIHFEKEVTGGGPAGDFVFFESADDSLGTKNTPQLIVKYY